MLSPVANFRAPALSREKGTLGEVPCEVRVILRFSSCGLRTPFWLGGHTSTRLANTRRRYVNRFRAGKAARPGFMHYTMRSLSCSFLLDLSLLSFGLASFRGCLVCDAFIGGVRE